MICTIPRTSVDRVANDMRWADKFSLLAYMMFRHDVKRTKNLPNIPVYMQLPTEVFDGVSSASYRSVNVYSDCILMGKVDMYRVTRGGIGGWRGVGDCVGLGEGSG